jgi:site-specific recombinase XerD
LFSKKEASMSDPPRVRMSGPLVPYADGFSIELQRQGYKPRPVAAQLWVMAHLSRWMASEDLRGSDLTPPVVETFVGTRQAAGYTNLRSAKALCPLLAYLRGVHVIPDAPPAVASTPLEVLLERYRDHLTMERGLTGPTACNYIRKVRPFLASRVTADGIDLEHLTVGDVSAFVLAECSRLPKSAGLVVTALRSVLTFLHVDGSLERSLAAAVPAIARWKLAGLPRALEADQVSGLMGSCDRGTAAGRRDFAILTLLLRLGMRAGEVATLELDDLDWRAGEILVRGKGDRHERLPLPADVGEALSAHLRSGRPKTAQDRCVFVRVRAPHRALTASGVSLVVSRAGQRSGLGKVHAHRLRHTAATQMLRAGASLTEIGQVLRHRRMLTTAIYAKGDRESLRTLARPWPGGAA